MTSRIVCFVMMSLLLVGGFSVTKAQDSESAADIDQDALLILKRMSEKLGLASEFSFRAEIFDQGVTEAGQKIDYTQLLDIVVKRPNHVWALNRGDVLNMRFHYDGKQIVLLDLLTDQYSVAPVPGTIDKMFTTLLDDYGIDLPLSDFLFSSPYEVLTGEMISATYVGLSVLEGIYCHHLAFTQENIDWQIWIEDSGRMVPRQLVITYKKEDGSPDFRASISDWDFSPSSPDGLFQFEPFETMRQIELVKTNSE